MIAQEEPRVPVEDQHSNKKAIDDDKRQGDKSKSDRKTRDKNNPMPKRKDQNPKER